jgi:membrane-bound inhibitor of C-type lysozyme
MDRVFDAMNVFGKAAFAAIALAILLSCSQANVGKEQSWLSFRCPDGQTVMARFQPQDQFVNVRFAGREMRLPRVISGSGARYSDGKTTLWNRGRSVFVEVDDKIVVQYCMLQGERQSRSLTIYAQADSAGTE